MTNPVDLHRRTLLQAAGLATLAAALPGGAAAAAKVSAPELPDTLTTIADQALEDMASPGIQISVWKNQQPLAQVARGLANLETSTPVSAATIFRAGSLSKQFTAATIARLQEQGKLSFDDRLDRHLGFFPGKDAPTLLELIHHTAGVHDQEEDSINLVPATQLDLAKRIAAQGKLYDFPPGSAWLYSNSNYILLGAVVGAVTGRPLAQAASQLLFEPLGLEDTRFDAEADVVRNRASGYTQSDAGFVHAPFLPIEQAGGAGAVRSTARDLCRWHQAVFAGKLVSAKTLATMIEPARLRDGRPITQGRFNAEDDNMGETSYGFGLLLDRSAKDRGLIAMHNGFISGFSAYLATHVPSMTTVACMTNADPGPKLPFRQLRRTIFAPYLPNKT